MLPILDYDALRQLTRGTGRADRAPALQARAVAHGLRLPLAGEIEQLRTAHRDAMQRAGHVVVTVWPRR